VEKTILKNLLTNETYVRRVLPFIQPEYFQDTAERHVYGLIQSFFSEYNSAPSKEALLIDLENSSDIAENTYDSVKAIIDDITVNQESENLDWLVEKTETFCQDRAIYNGIMKSIEIADGKSENVSRGSIPDILADALSVSFNENIGHDLIEDANSRFDFYHRVENRVPFDIELLNKITNGGLPEKTLNVLMAPTGVGKTMVMCHFAAANVMDGRNVLYITNEMAEEKIAERIEANLMNMDIQDIHKLPKDVYDKKMEALKSKLEGRLKIKEYPTSMATVNHFRFLLNELKLKKNFVPDIIYVDYLNICASSRYKSGSAVGSYTIVKAIAEELRGLAVERRVPIVTATQVNRSGFKNSDIDLENTSESFGIPATADLMLALVTSDELEELGQLMIKQLKNRYSDAQMFKRFVVGVERSKMRIFDCENEAQSLSNLEGGSAVVNAASVNKTSKEKFESFKI